MLINRIGRRAREIADEKHLLFSQIHIISQLAIIISDQISKKSNNNVFKKFDLI